MLYVYFGENESESRLKYRSHIEILVKEGYDNVAVEQEELLQKLQNNQSSSLFNEKILYSSENCLSDKTLVENLKKIQNDKNIVIVLWENKKDSRSIKKMFPKESLFESKFPASIFTFLDSIRPNNLDSVYNQLNIIRQTNEPNMIHYMLTKRMLELLFILNEKPLEGYQQWQVWKLKKQAEMFGIEKTEKLFQTLVRLERQEKTGTTPFTLDQALDITLCFYLS